MIEMKTYRMLKKNMQIIIEIKVYTVTEIQTENAIYVLRLTGNDKDKLINRMIGIMKYR